jgi:hypothetical protein
MRHARSVCGMRWPRAKEGRKNTLSLLPGRHADAAASSRVLTAVFAMEDDRRTLSMQRNGWKATASDV